MYIYVYRAREDAKSDVNKAYNSLGDTTRWQMFIHEVTLV